MTNYARDGISTDLFLLDTKTDLLCEKGDVVQPSEIACGQIKRAILQQCLGETSKQSLRMFGRHHNFGIGLDQKAEYAMCSRMCRTKVHGNQSQKDD